MSRKINKLRYNTNKRWENVIVPKAIIIYILYTPQKDKLLYENLKFFIDFRFTSSELSLKFDYTRIVTDKKQRKQITIENDYQT